MYEKEHSPDLYGAEYQLSVDHESPIRPDSHYGSSKAAGEAWGRQYAENHNINFYALRIGSVRPPTWDHPYGDAERGVDEGEWERGNQAYERMVARLKCTWQSRQDLAHLVEQCLDDEQVSFGIFYGISDNSNSWFELDNARERIGYTPRDSADDPRWDKEYETGP
ncbi:NAD-dependent epimerase/dehydratase [Haloferax larsenii JCM 13917]|nr:NAD-dependent epimerase/dehydratase [Haloferax larsenii JCM 13917]